MTALADRSRRRWLATVTAGAMFMENLDATAIVTALPAMAASFGSTAVATSLGVTAYLLAAAVLVPLSAWLADRLGPRDVCCAAMALFVLASLACGLSVDLPSFVASRVLQGAAAALMTPVARLAVVRGSPKAELMQAVAIMTWPALMAPVLGPLLGGLLTTYASWRWVFFINLPIGLLGIALAWRLMPTETVPQRWPFDAPGFVLLAGALVALLSGLGELALASPAGQGLVWGLGGLVLGTALGALALRHARRAAHPLVGVQAMRVHSFFVTTLSGGLLSRLAISAVPFLLPLMLQVAFGMSPVAAGALVLAYFAGNIGLKLFTTRLLRRFGFRRVLMVNGGALAASVLACAFIAPQTSVWMAAAALVLAGCCRSLQMTALNSLAFADVPGPDMAAANTLASLVQQVSMAAGVAVGALLLNVGPLLQGGSGLARQDFQFALAGLAALAALAVLPYGRLSREAGAVVSGHGPQAAAQ